MKSAIRSLLLLAGLNGLILWSLPLRNVEPAPAPVKRHRGGKRVKTWALAMNAAQQGIMDYRSGN